MSSEERPESLAAQAAAWVPPWERRRDPDPGYPASVEEPTEPAPEPSVAEPVPEPVAVDPEPVPVVPEPVAVVPEPVAVVPEAEPVPEVVPEPVAAVPVQPRRPRASAAAAVESAVRTQAPVLMDDADLTAALESIMLVVDEPVGELQLAQVLEQPVERIARALEGVSARYTAAGHGIDLRRVAGGWRLYTRPEYAAYVERFVLDGQSVRLTQAALETLAVVAYKQPVTRSRISAIRGVNCDGVMRTLVTRGLIEECGTEPETGAYLYRTTPLFLEKLGLNSVDQLPPLAPFLPDDVEEVLDASG
ncbi:MAG TPA: SMC-Scp complex subunit ScpB [Actinoplanes sp.]|nr:SMC-Scp complex subunit ScpB [Actinoplanes sp.]